MIYLKIITLALVLSGVSTSLFAQDYTVSSKTQRINDTKYEGHSISVAGTLEKVTAQAYAYLKEKSKIRRKRSFYSISEIKMGGLQLDSTILYLKINEKAAASSVWLGIKTFGLSNDITTKIEDAIQKELVLIARDYYVHQQELKIKEAETAAQVVSKKQQFLIDEKVDLTGELESKEARKVELDNLLEENRLAIEVLKQKIIDNQFNQDSTYLDLQKVNRVIEIQKQKLKEID